MGFRDEQRAKQLIDFDAMLFLGMRGTDADYECDVKGRGWFLVEVKHSKNLRVNQGQRLAFERKVDDLSATGKPAVQVVAVHDVENPQVMVDIASCRVREYYMDGSWSRGSGTVREFFATWVQEHLPALWERGEAEFLAVASGEQST